MRTAQRVARLIIVVEIIWLLLACVLAPWRAGLPTSMVLRPYGIPLIAAAMLFASLRMSWKGQLLIAAATVPAALVLLPLEYALGSPSRRLDRAFERGSQVPALRANGTTVFPILAPWDLAYGHRTLKTPRGDLLPLTGLANRPTALCQIDGSELVFQADSLGMRNVRPVGHADIALLGDSFAQGYCVTENASIAGKLNSQFGSVENFGVTGAGPVWELGVIREFVSLARPRLVVWVFYEGNDLEGVDAESSGFAGRYLDPAFTQHLAHRKPEVEAALLSRLDSLGDSFNTRAVDRLRNLILFREIRGRLALAARPPEAALAPAGSPVDDALPVLRKILSIAKNEVSAWGGTIVFVYLPERDRFAAEMRSIPERKMSGHRAAHPSVMSIVDSLGIDAIDMTPVFAAQASPLRLFDSGGIHYTAAGYSLVADSIGSYVRRRAILHGAAFDSGFRASAPPAVDDRWMNFGPLSESSIVRGLSRQP